jgi:hypothetical protein
MKNILIVLGIFFLVFLIVLGRYNQPEGRYYNCRDIDFLPDVPPQIREECRKIIKERLEEKKQQEQNNKLMTA